MAKQFVIDEKLENIDQTLQKIEDALLHPQSALVIVDGSGEWLDQAFSAMINGYNTTKLFARWWSLASDTPNRYDRLCRWFRILSTAWADKVYTLRAPHYSISNGVTMLTPMADLAGKTAASCCTEASDVGVEWADEDPMTWYVRANALSLQDGTMNITAIEGIDDDFDITGESAPVYTFSNALWRTHFTDGQYEYKSWATKQSGNMRPYARDVGLDNQKRDMCWMATFGGGLTSDGKLTSGVGTKSVVRQSAAAGLTKARLWNNYESGWTDTDRYWLLDMWQLRHFDLENSGIIEGCTNYNYQYVVAAAENGVKRVLLTAAQAANFLVGSNVCLGTHPEGTNTDRNTAANYNLADMAKILSIEVVTVSDVSYTALNLDLAEAIDVPATAYVSTMPWTPGSTEALPGHKDGSIGSLTNGKTPARIAGVECIDGAYTIGLEPLWSVSYDANRNPNQIISVYACRDCENQGSSVSANHVLVGTIERESTPSWAWHYIKHFAINNEDALMPDAWGATGSSYYKSAVYLYPSSGVRAPWVFCRLDGTTNAGLAGSLTIVTPSYAVWDGRPRLGGCGKKRGEWQAAPAA